MMWSKACLLLSVTLLVGDALSLQVIRSYGSFKGRHRRGEPLCTLPPQPANGRYKVTGGSVTGGAALFINLEYSCEPTYQLDGDAGAFCYAGDWNRLPRCVQTCRLARHRSVRYDCIISGTEHTRACRDTEPDGALVQPSCRRPHYYTPIELPYMTCTRGRWNTWPTCIPECGLLNAGAGAGAGARRSPTPWHAAVYNKNILAATHEHVCSGSLISNSVILSAARCFWDEGSRAIKEATNYAVAVGKVHSDWQHPDDEPHAQRSDVKKIVVPKAFRGAEGGYEGDLAVVVVTRGFEYQHHVLPVCLDFRRDILDRQLVAGNIGKSAGWGADDGASGAALQPLDMPFVSRGDCTTSSNDDKLCAGNTNGPGLCGTDLGSGLTFAATIQNSTRYYLRGVAGKATACNTTTTFTSIMKHQGLIKMYWFL